MCGCILSQCLHVTLPEDVSARGNFNSVEVGEFICAFTWERFHIGLHVCKYAYVCMHFCVWGCVCLCLNGLCGTCVCVSSPPSLLLVPLSLSPED